VVTNGELALRGYRDKAWGGQWTTAGVQATSRLVGRFGSYFVRLRVDPGRGLAFTALLWPGDRRSTVPEVDFAEDNGRDRQTLYAALHYVDSSGRHDVRRQINVDLTAWHVVGLAWRSQQLRFYLDGRVWSTIDGPVVPQIPMALALQQQAWGCGTDPWEACPDASTPRQVDTHIDWVKVFAPS
jgi:beta-glucanase (GH16 family)